MSGRTIKRSDKVMTLSHPEKVRLIALLLEAFLQVMQGAHIDETHNDTSIVMGTRSGTLVVQSLQNLTLIRATGIEHPDRHMGLNGGFWIFPKLLRDLFFSDHSYRLLPICLYEATSPLLVAGALPATAKAEALGNQLMVQPLVIRTRSVSESQTQISWQIPT
jgi:hypothetical protein